MNSIEIMSSQQNDDESFFPVKNGIENCEDLCKCGEHIRLHTYVFGRKHGKSVVKYYVDCPKCMTASDWHLDPYSAIDEFDSMMALNSQ